MKITAVAFETDSMEERKLHMQCTCKRNTVIQGGSPSCSNSTLPIIPPRTCQFT